MVERSDGTGSLGDMLACNTVVVAEKRRAQSEGSAVRLRRKGVVEIF